MTASADDPTAYHALLSDVLSEIRAAHVRAGRVVTAERTLPCWTV